MTMGKKLKAVYEKIDRNKFYSVEEAVKFVKEGAKGRKFDESVDLAVNLAVDPKHADQMVRGTVVLPHGTGSTKRVVVIASGEKLKEAEAAGADHAGGAEMVARIQEGWVDFDAVISTPDMMREVGKLGKVLGPRGLMPNPKTGTVTFDVAQAVNEIKAGKVEFRVDKGANIHVAVGKLSFNDDKLVDNAKALLNAIVRAKPATAKGKYLISIYVASTMGPGVPVDTVALEAAL